MSENTQNNTQLPPLSLPVSAVVPPKALPPLVRSRPPPSTAGTSITTTTSTASNSLATSPSAPPAGAPLGLGDASLSHEAPSTGTQHNIAPKGKDENRELDDKESASRKVKRKERFSKPRKRVPVPSDVGSDDYVDSDIVQADHRNRDENNNDAYSSEKLEPAGADYGNGNKPNLCKSASALRSSSPSLPPLSHGPASLLAPVQSSAPCTSPSEVLSNLYGDVEYEETTSHPLHSLAPSHPTPRHREQAIHDTVFVESATTGKFKKTDANAIPTQQQPTYQLPSDNTTPATPMSRASAFEQSFATLHTIFVLIQGLTAGYGLLEVYTSVGYLQADSGAYEEALINVIGITHRTFLTLGVACLLSVFAQYAKLPTAPTDKVFTPSDKALSRSGSHSPVALFFQNPKSTIFLALTYLFVVITLLVDAQHIDRIEIAHKDHANPAVNLHTYFILNAIRGASVILAWIIVVVNKHPVL